MAAYYNEIEPYAAEWLRNLIRSGHIPDGEVDTRSIVDVQPLELRGFTQCHFFAGIGGWGLALRLAGWSDDRQIWTGSCPCQPFSSAGKGAGTDDPRHLWPHFHRLIAANRPPVVMGEQVAGQAGYGWFDGVRTDLEGTGYASRAVDIPALAVNAPHIRQRLYWVAMDLADAQNNGQDRWAYFDAGRQENERCRDARVSSEPIGSGSSVRSHMADAQSIGREERERQDGQQDAGSGSQGRVDAAGTDKSDMADAQSGGDHPPAGYGHTAAPEGRSGHWDDHIWLTGSDGKARRSQPGLPLLAHGVSNRVGRLRAYGNAIVPQVAAEVISAFMESV